MGIYIQSFLNFSLFFSGLGVLLSFIAITIVANAAVAVVGQIRRGLLSFLWGLSFFLISFLYTIFRFHFNALPDLQSLIMVFGMILILLSSRKLFSFSKQL